MNKILAIMLLSVVSSCSWMSFDYWRIRDVVSEYQKRLYSLEFGEAGAYLTIGSKNKLADKLNKDFSDKELKNYRKLSEYSSFKIKEITIKDKEAVVVIEEKVPDMELIFGTIISWHMDKTAKEGENIPLDVLIDNFIDNVVSEDPGLFLTTQELTYLIVLENNQWKIKFD